jgi:hypothetical protein
MDAQPTVQVIPETPPRVSLCALAVGDGVYDMQRFLDNFIHGLDTSITRIMAYGPTSMTDEQVRDYFQPIQDDGVIPIIVTLARTDNAHCKIWWLRNITANAWYVLHVAVHTPEPLAGAVAARCLSNIEFATSDNNFLVRFTNAAGISRGRLDDPEASQVRSIIMSAARDGIPPPRHVNRFYLSTPSYTDWSFTIVGPDESTANAMAVALCTEPWVECRYVGSSHVTAIYWCDQTTIVQGNVPRGLGYVNPALGDWTISGPFYHVTFVAVAVSDIGTIPDGMVDWFSNNTDQFSHTIVCWLLPDPSTILTLNVLATTLWRDRIRLLRRTAQYIYRARTRGVTDLWTDLLEPPGGWRLS